MSFVLVLVAAVFLVIGLLQSGLTLIYVSIGASVLAGVMLFVAVLRRRPREDKAKVEVRPAPPTAVTPVTPAPKVESSPAPLSSSWGRPTPEVASDEPTMAVPVQVDEADDFPIAGYDELRVSEIISRLPDLDADELTAVREREVAGRSRSAVLNRIDDQLASTPADPAWEVSESDWDSGAEGDDFPIPNYDDLTVAQILERLGDLDDDELNEVAEREEDGEGRAAILDRIDELLDDEGAPIEEPLPRAPARKAAGRKAVAKKAPAKKAAPARKAVAKKAPAKKAAPARKAVATKAAAKAPVKKAAAKKAPVKKAVAKKAPAKRAGR